MPRILRQEARPSQTRHRIRTTGVGRVDEDGRSTEAGCAAAAAAENGFADEYGDFVDDAGVAGVAGVAVVVGAVKGIVEVV